MDYLQLGKVTTVVVFAVILALLLTLFIAASVALANNGPHLGGTANGDVSGGFPQDTDACAGCHRAHTGTAAKLLKSGDNVYSFCITCHDGAGANTNVLSGLWEGGTASQVVDWGSQNDGQPGMGLNGGGFLNAVKYNGRSGRNPDTGGPGANYGSATSRHNLEGLDGAGPWVAWGGGTTGYGASGSMSTANPLYGGGLLTLTCTGCHDPHGSKNADDTERYRILLRRIKRWDGATSAQLIDVAFIQSNEPIDSQTGLQVKDYTADKYKVGIIDFCEACHTQYISTSSVYNANDGNGYNLRYRHVMGAYLNLGDNTTGNGMPINTNLNNHVKLPVQQTTYSADIKGTDYQVCLTCHQAHGSSAAMTDIAMVGPTATAPLTGSSTLLRLNNRGVCQDCHQR